MSVENRETREGWPLLTVETQVNWDSKRTIDRGPSLVSSLDLSCRYRRFLFCLGCSSQPSTKYYFSHRTLFHFISLRSPATWVLQSCRVACLCVSGRENMSKSARGWGLVIMLTNRMARASHFKGGGSHLGKK
jgi:hypothetical protein